ncbi:CPBP family intramembrane metalloprotease [Rubrobacter marinus]|uniref:CPBP family intramembrane metalloprotease n=1 Tax=Rubrobacter marinus TaxID=2653852 RepID=A0A6G8Q2T4_9ACTN|nr:CPBP family intramembrane metalloprotease [Rubrobacter marinus]
MLAYGLLPFYRKLAEKVAPLLVDGARGRDLVGLAVLSGVGEEALFRGALQPEIGIVASSLLFGALHVGPDRRYLLWTLWAVGAGFLFGALYAWTGVSSPLWSPTPCTTPQRSCCGGVPGPRAAARSGRPRDRAPEHQDQGGGAPVAALRARRGRARGAVARRGGVSQGGELHARGGDRLAQRPRRRGERREQALPAAGRQLLRGAARDGLRLPERRGPADRGGHAGRGAKIGERLGPLALLRGGRRDPGRRRAGGPVELRRGRGLGGREVRPADGVRGSRPPGNYTVEISGSPAARPGARRAQVVRRRALALRRRA